MTSEIFIKDYEVFYICINYPDSRQYFKCWFQEDDLYRQHIGGRLDKLILPFEVEIFKLFINNGFIEFVDEKMNDLNGKEVSLKSFLKK